MLLLWNRGSIKPTSTSNILLGSYRKIYEQHSPRIPLHIYSDHSSSFLILSSISYIKSKSPTQTLTPLIHHTHTHPTPPKAHQHRHSDAPSPHFRRHQTRLLPLHPHALHPPRRGTASLRTLPGSWLDSEAGLGQAGTACGGHGCSVSFLPPPRGRVEKWEYGKDIFEIG
jgi:hypothetical protein